MKRPVYGRSPNFCVPVSTAGHRSPEQASQSRPIGLNKRHEDSLLSFLEHHYGWHLGDDGNLYSPHIRHSAGMDHAA